MAGSYPERWWTEEVAGEHIDECTDKELEVFLRNSRSLIIYLQPEPDDFHQTTDAGIVSIKWKCLLDVILMPMRKSTFILRMCVNTFHPMRAWCHIVAWSWFGSKTWCLVFVGQ